MKLTSDETADLDPVTKLKYASFRHFLEAFTTICSLQTTHLGQPLHAILTRKVPPEMAALYPVIVPSHSMHLALQWNRMSQARLMSSPLLDC